MAASGGGPLLAGRGGTVVFWGIILLERTGSFFDVPGRAGSFSRAGTWRSVFFCADTGVLCFFFNDGCDSTRDTASSTVWF